jgi:hypothetical protein
MQQHVVCMACAAALRIRLCQQPQRMIHVACGLCNQPLRQQGRTPHWQCITFYHHCRNSVVQVHVCAYAILSPWCFVAARHAPLQDAAFLVQTSFTYARSSLGSPFFCGNQTP